MKIKLGFNGDLYRICITIEILEENATIKKCGPVHKGRYFKVIK